MAFAASGSCSPSQIEAMAKGTSVGHIPGATMIRPRFRMGGIGRMAPWSFTSRGEGTDAFVKAGIAAGGAGFSMTRIEALFKLIPETES